MYYSIGEISGITGISASTLRYYDKEGLFPALDRSNGGIRIFTESEIGAIKIIECLKSTGLSIKDIKQYMDWYRDGDASLHKRRDLFYQRLEVVKEQQKILDKTMDMIKFKCWYYDTAVEAGSEAVVKGKAHDKLPGDIQKLAKAFSE
jgi:DNA-binding transcriptional MerR regulator